MNELTNTTDEPEDQHESTYALLVRSEEKSRNLLEMAIYPLLIIGAIIAIWQFVLQPMNLPSLDTNAALSVTSVACAVLSAVADCFDSQRFQLAEIW